LAEVGAVDYDFPIWYGVWAPAATPSRIVDRLASGVTCALTQPAVHAWFVNHGMEPMSMTPEAFAAFVADETRRAAHIINATSATLS
jgi:tripartite-type tricarboxylate transporter receptor subunit TctC